MPYGNAGRGSLVTTAGARARGGTGTSTCHHPLKLTWEVLSPGPVIFQVCRESCCMQLYRAWCSADMAIRTLQKIGKGKRAKCKTETAMCTQIGIWCVSLEESARCSLTPRILVSETHCWRFVHSLHHCGLAIHSHARRNAPQRPRIPQG